MKDRHGEFPLLLDEPLDCEAICLLLEDRPEHFCDVRQAIVGARWLKQVTSEEVGYGLALPHQDQYREALPSSVHNAPLELRKFVQRNLEAPQGEVDGRRGEDLEEGILGHEVMVVRVGILESNRVDPIPQIIHCFNYSPPSTRYGRISAS